MKNPIMALKINTMKGLFEKISFLLKLEKIKIVSIYSYLLWKLFYVLSLGYRQKNYKNKKYKDFNYLIFKRAILLIKRLFKMKQKLICLYYIDFAAAVNRSLHIY